MTDKEQLTDDATQHSSTVYNAILTSSFNAFRAYAPQIVPLIVCTLLIPLVLVISLLAGWLVWKNASVSWEVPIYLQYGDGSQPYAQVWLPSLVLQQRYDISVQLDIPLTESNLALGNFMTSLSLSTPTNKTLLSVRRPTFILAPKTSFFSIKSNVIKLDVPLLKAYLPGTSKLIALVELGRQDAWKSLGGGEGREVSILAAHIQGAIVYHGIRGFVSRFPLISGLLSTAGFFIMLSVMLSGCILPNVLHRHHESELDTAQPHEQNEDEQSDESGTDSEDKSSLRTRRVRRSQHSQAVRLDSIIFYLP
ncbi:putative adipose-regulatory protein-domain-containing protein [Amanita rubescens]|nr:putative adipose-regulatory protein-domain-containing protein [Amanita rubescens]